MIPWLKVLHRRRVACHAYPTKNIRALFFFFGLLIITLPVTNLRNYLNLYRAQLAK